LGVRELVERLKDLISLDLDKIRNIISRFYNAKLKIQENRNLLMIPLNGSRWSFSENML